VAVIPTGAQLSAPGLGRTQGLVPLLVVSKVVTKIKWCSNQIESERERERERDGGRERERAFSGFFQNGGSKRCQTFVFGCNKKWYRKQCDGCKKRCKPVCGLARCVCAWCVCVCLYVYMYVCACARVCVYIYMIICICTQTHTHTHTHTHAHTHTHTHLSICISIYSMANL